MSAGASILDTSAARPSLTPSRMVRASAGVALVAAAPLLAASAACIFALSRRSPFIAHLRAGQYGRPFWVLKLRTMWPDDKTGARFAWVEHIQDGDGPRGKGPADGRVTSRFAAFCRRHSIDELPQLWHILTNEMAWVGPRPMTREELLTYYGDDAEEILRMKPGLTGLWQVSGRSRLSYRVRRELDLYLVRHASWRLRLSILWRSVGAVLTGRDAW